MSGFYDDSGEDNGSKKMVILAILAASLVFLAFLLFLYQKTKPDKQVVAQNTSTQEEAQEEDLQIGKSNLTSQDMDFWDMFRDPDEKTEEEIEANAKDDVEGKSAVFTEQGPKPDKIKENKDTSENGDPDSKWENGDPNEGTHIAITDADGKKTWYEILDIPKSAYSATFLKEKDNGTVYYEENDKKSAGGADLNSDCSVTDLKPLKEEGVTFVMLRAVMRDHLSGVIVPDTSFSNFTALAKDAEIPTGIYVDTAAINETEAIEEANYAVANAQAIGAKFPVAINFGKVAEGDRNSNLNNEIRTKVAKAFCDQVRSYGQKPMIRATKEDLITKLNMEDLVAYDIWVVDAGEKKDDHPYFTDFPYVFTMWQYANGANKGAFPSGLMLDLSFVNYEQN
ncbi:MAG: hypothetical protein K6D90_11135 [Lachnospiraceae bacterium]|nr:hypothetical protein [Lachnospiraceae bacterium]